MSTRLTSTHLDVIAALVAEYPEGASLEQLRQRMSPMPPDRTLKRWLAELVSDRRIELIGKARDARYRTRRLRTADTSATVQPPVAPAPAALNAAILAGGSTDARPVEERVFDLVLGIVMRKPYAREHTTLLVQSYVEIMAVPMPERAACSAWIEARLQALTLEDAMRYRYTAQQYANWRAKYDAASSSAPVPDIEPSALNIERPISDDAASSALSTPSNPDRGNAEERKRGTKPTPSEVSALSPELSVPPSAAALAAPTGSNLSTPSFTLSAPTGHPPQSTGPSPHLSTLDAQFSTDSASPTRAEAFITRAIGTGRQLAKPARAAISAGWGATLTLSVDAIGAQGPTWLVTAPLAAIPSLVFLVRDRMAANESLDAPSVTAALTAGGGALAVGKSLAAMAHSAFL